MDLTTLALEVFEDMMSFFESKAISLGYNFEDVPDLNSQTGVSHEHNLMMKSNLGVKLSPDFGKEIPLALDMLASTTLSASVGAAAYENLTEVQYPNRMPLGSGNTLRNNQRHKFYRNFQVDPIDSRTNLMAAGNIEDYKESYHTFLSGDTITTVVITESDGLIVSNQSTVDEDVLYRVEAKESQTSGSNQTVKIVLTTNSGRVENRVIKFSVTGLI